MILSIRSILSSFSLTRKISPFLGLLILGGCALASLNEIRLETAQRIASAAWMVGRDIPAGNFLLRGYERMHEHNAPANVYIEGNGGIGFTNDPTPMNPVALHLASKDNAENLVYLARPCQYIGIGTEDSHCSPEYWGDKKYSPEVIEAYDAALDEIAKRYDIKGFNLIGYDGGAAIATLLAAKRTDVLTLRTVAGILDTEIQTGTKAIKPSEGSLNPISQASTLNRTPQYHFIGGQDSIVPPSILNSYMQATPPSPCVHTMMVQEAGHDDGWVDKWPELLALPVSCYGAAQGFDAYDVDTYGFGTGVEERGLRVPSVHRTVPEVPEKP